MVVFEMQESFKRAVVGLPVRRAWIYLNQICESQEDAGRNGCASYIHISLAEKGYLIIYLVV